jgi:tRNA nucleotidyltransferase/poly(A) polymerase
MQQPRVSDLSEPMARAAREVAARLKQAGHRGWIVGGAVRDLALGEAPGDVDMASAATPDEVAALFEHTVPVGAAFGTVLVLVEGREVQLTTFRAEGGYSDSRRPDQVRFGTRVEQDAARRDFTCNALYLDPLDDTLLDPEGGRADIEARRLRCVGDPHERFREDGLRLVRLARFSARLDFEVEGEVRDAARAEAASLVGVSAERRLAELGMIFAGPRPWVAVGLLEALGLLPRLIPGWSAPSGTTLTSALERLGDAPGVVAGLALLLDGGAPEDAQRLEGLRPSRDVRRDVGTVWRLMHQAEALLGGGAQARSTRIRLVRDPLWETAARLIEARGAGGPALEELRAFAAGLTAKEREPELLLTVEDFEAHGVPRGPEWGRLLNDAEERQLDGRLKTRDEALAWLAQRVG